MSDISHKLDSHPKVITREMAFSSLDLVGQCLVDRKRSEVLDQAIRGVHPSPVTIETRFIF